MKSRWLAVLLLVLVTTVPAAAQFQTVEPVTIKGAYGLIVIPDNWNGSLFIYAHGYSADNRLLQPFPSDLTPADFLTLDPGGRVNLLFRAAIFPLLNGYASATTTFSSAGWYVKDAVKDIENLRRYFVKKYGKPKHTYLWGHSGGGMVTSTVIEYFPKTYEGALPMCGPAAGATSTPPGTCGRSTSTCVAASPMRASAAGCAATARAVASTTATARTARRAAPSNPRPRPSRASAGSAPSSS